MESFLQSNLWMDFQKKLGRKIFDIQGIKITEHKIALNKSFLYSPRISNTDNFEEFIKEIKEIAEKENAIFFKLELQREIDKNLLEKFNFSKSNNIQPLQTIILDLTKTEEELLAQMHQKTRYNSNLAQKKGIKIRAGRSDDNFEEFWRLMQETTKRDGFCSYPKEYYKKLLEIPGVELFLAEFDNKIIVANIVLFYENQAIYLHGASSYEHRNLMAAPLLQWYQIQEAKKIDCTTYDFWGINEQKWPGVTRFKRGFGGQEITYPGAYDLIFKPFWYRIYKIAKEIL
ncbi:MAG: peptidoglycan bridge formation glycyltransferase FemA/FemB family protein [Candidatus Portnoybacteria bacterium]|nr:peptidoglycan bridge formation glycyltransferase FemA/FemB family protein [Candidatus Portnoybacteria bacterium]